MSPMIVISLSLSLSFFCSLAAAFMRMREDTTPRPGFYILMGLAAGGALCGILILATGVVHACVTDIP